MIVVVDASLAAKWMLWEADTLKAIGFLHEYGGQLVAPELIFVEVASAIVRRGNENKPLQAEALRALEKWTVAWSDHVVKSYRVTQRRLFNASSMALTIGHPLKDCINLALAMELDAEFATCDAKLRDKALALYPRIRLLDDYPTASLPTSK